MKKLLSILGSVGMIGTAGATVVACGKSTPPKEAPKEAPEKAKGKLGSDIFEAQGLVNTGTKEENAKVALENAVKEAQDVFDKKEATVTELQTASENLRKAIEKYNNSKEATVVLTETIDEANALLEKAEKEASAVTALKNATKAAQKVLDETKTDTARINEATKQLKTAIEIYKNAENKQNPKEAAKIKLKSLIEQAKELANTSKKEASVTEMLQTAMDKAQQVLDKPEVTEVELTDETVALQEAIDKFNEAPDKDPKTPIEVAKEALQARINDADGLIINSKKEDAITKALKTASEEAKKVLVSDKSNESDLKEATTTLTKAIEKFNAAPNKGENNPVEVAKEALKSKINAARVVRMLKGPRKTKEENEAFDKIIDKAQKVYDTSKNVDEIKAVAEELFQATKDF